MTQHTTDAVPPASPNSETRSAESPPVPRAKLWLYALVAAAVVAATGWLGWQWNERQPPARFRRALSALDRHDSAGVRRELNGWPNSFDFEAHRHFLTGALLLRDGKPQMALESLGRSVNHPDLRVRTLVLTGGALYQMSRHQDAEGVLQRALEADPENVDAHLWLGSIYYDLGVNPRALEHFLAAAELDPKTPRPHRLIGLMHKDFEHFSEAIEAYEESLRRSDQQPDIDDIRLELAECHVKRLDHEQAMKQLKLCPDSPARDVLEAECLRATGDEAAAAAKIARVLAADPQNLKALTLQGTARLESGDAKGAAESLGRAVELHPHDYVARFKYSQALQRAGRPDDAAEQNKLATETKQLYEKFTAQHDKAEKEPENVQIRYELGQTALSLGRPDLAVGWFRMALALDSHHADSRKALQKLQESSAPRPGGTR